MVLTRRNVAAVGDTKPRSSSLWEDEANEHWKEMEPVKKRSQYSKSIVCMLLLLVVAAGVGLFLLSSSSEGGTFGITALRERFLSSGSAATTETAAATAASSAAPAAASGAGSVNAVFDNNPAAVDLLRARCRLTCDQLPVADVPSATKCPDGVSCKMACKAYDTEKPFPDMHNSCERACATIEPSSCSRIPQIYKDLYHGTLQ
ncbi:hypothetical protein FI667_g8719, partial [Globisporangium splendens]